jgi:hypothetical protein
MYLAGDKYGNCCCSICWTIRQTQKDKAVAIKHRIVNFNFQALVLQLRQV